MQLRKISQKMEKTTSGACSSGTIHPVPNEPNVPVPLPSTAFPVIPSDLDHPQDQGFNTEYEPSEADSPQPFSLVECNDLTIYLGLTKEVVELLGSR
ncbi:hypothetical protein NPIL_374351 [Nephila pilipes]|uniref:Uncharacterized protein n=1 Tax=Nephila pilipes TaxID=299642 RepID=A0A8X6N3I0_NEPPI|nr:hypothetical protein NPIL_374351 [Nephila pilipes]